MAHTELPATMRAATFTSTAGGLEKNIHLNPSAPLPANAASLLPDSTLVKVAYASPNPVDYKLPENFIFNRLVLPKAKDGSAIPVGDFAGEVIATTLPNLKPGDQGKFVQWKTTKTLAHSDQQILQCSVAAIHLILEPRLSTWSQKVVKLLFPCPKA